MKLSEYRKELHSLLEGANKLDERLKTQSITADWLVERSNEICQKIDVETDELKREKYLNEALELAARLTSEMRMIEKDHLTEKQIKQKLKDLDKRVANEGLE